MQAISDNLIHFLDKKNKEFPDRQFETFKKIINKGLLLERHKVSFDGGEINCNFTCFTDLPLSLCKEHTYKYGSFGIGFKKSSIKIFGGNPASYFVNQHYGQFHEKGPFFQNLSDQFKLVNKLYDLKDNPKFELYDHDKKQILSNNEIKQWVEHQLALLAFIKGAEDLDNLLQEDHLEDSFYREREWRLLQLRGNSNIIVKNEKEEFHFEFKRDHINMILTPNDNIRIKVAKFFSDLDINNSRLKEFADNPLPIISYEDLQKW